jgi:hypothetical protein
MIISQGPRAILERSACVTYPLKIQPAVLPPFGVVTHRHNISDIAKKPVLKDRAFIELLQAAQRIQTLRLF